MEQQRSLPDLGASVDWETFQRVWKRVMPDESKSPIELVLPPGANRHKPSPATVQQNHEKTEEHTHAEDIRSKKNRSQTVSTEELLEELCRGIASVMTAAQQQGRGSVSAMLLHQRQYALRQLQTVYFLDTGRNYTCKPVGRASHRPSMQFLREQYRWEQEWAGLCETYRAQINGSDTGQLCGQLIRQALERQQSIRKILEHGAERRFP